MAHRTEEHLFFLLHQPVVPYTARSTWCIYASASQQSRRTRLLNLLGEHHAIVLTGHLHKHGVVARRTPRGSFVQVAAISVLPSLPVTSVEEERKTVPTMRDALAHASSALTSGVLFCQLTLILILPYRGIAAERSDGEWKSLFDGKTLDGWEVREGEGKFFVEDGAIVGETTAGVKGSYLCTEATFDNFILELEFKVDEGLNSGVHIRSDVHQEETTTLYLSGKLKLVPRTYNAGQVFG